MKPMRPDLETPVEVEVVSKAPLQAREIDGLPHVHVAPLTIMRYTDEAACHFIPDSGVYIGVLCYSDTVLTFNPIVVPRMHLSRVYMAIEFASFDEIEAPPTCSLKAVFLGRDGKTRGLVTNPLPADGGVARVEFSANLVRAETVLATALKVILMDHLPAGTTLDVPSGVQGSGRRPILVRGAWLEFPFDG